MQSMFSELVASARRGMEVDNQLDPVFFRPFKLFLQIIQPGGQPAVIVFQIQIGIDFAPVADQLCASEICAIRRKIPIIRFFQVVAEHHSAKSRAVADTVAVFRHPAGIDFLHKLPARSADLQRVQIERNLAGTVLEAEIKNSLRRTFRNIRCKEDLFFKRSPELSRVLIHGVPFRRAVGKHKLHAVPLLRRLADIFRFHFDPEKQIAVVNRAQIDRRSHDMLTVPLSFRNGYRHRFSLHGGIHPRLPRKRLPEKIRRHGMRTQQAEHSQPDHDSFPTPNHSVSFLHKKLCSQYFPICPVTIFHAFRIVKPPAG